MQKILILVDKIGPRKMFEREYLAKNIKPVLKVDLYSFKDITIKIDKSVDAYVNGINITDYSLVYFKRAGDNYINLAAAIASILDKYDKKYLDRCFQEVGAAGDKLNDIVKLGLSGIAIPPTYYVDGDRVSNLKNHIVHELGFPIIVKSMLQQRREGIILIEKPSDFDHLSENLKGQGFMFQKFVKLSQEYRVVVMGDVVTAVHRESVRRFENGRIVYDTSESQGGFIVPDSCPSETIFVSIKATKALNLDISGVDVGLDEKGRVYIIEVNRGPGFTHDDKVSPELPELVKFLQGKMAE